MPLPISNTYSTHIIAVNWIS